MITIIHIFLAIVLFLIINFIGANSYSVGYMNLSIVYKEDTAPSLNLALRIFAPIVYLIIVSAIFAEANLLNLNHNIWLVVLYYIIFRLVVINLIVYNRFKLLNWTREVVCTLITTGLAYYVYNYFIRDNKYIFPNFTDITNEVWILIILFLFQFLSVVTNQSTEKSKKRKEDYVCYKYKKFKKEYGKNIDKIEKKLPLKILLYSIMIYEDFNRPPLIRFFENMISRVFKKKMTLGIMQVKTQYYISNDTSIELAIKKIHKALAVYKKAAIECYDWSAKRFIVKDYNNSEKYVDEVMEIYDQIKECFFKNRNDQLV